MEMQKKIVDYFKKIINGSSRKKLIENSIIVIIAGIIIIIAGGALFSKDSKSPGNEILTDNNKTTVYNDSVEEYGERELEQRIEDILSKIKGAGNVDVMVTYVSGNEIVPAYNIKTNENNTSEKDTEGGTRQMQQKDYDSSIAYEEKTGGDKKPVIIKDIMPQIKGVVVVADGGDEPVVKENLIRAVEALLDIPIHKIQIFRKK